MNRVDSMNRGAGSGTLIRMVAFSFLKVGRVDRQTDDERGSTLTVLSTRMRPWWLSMISCRLQAQARASLSDSSGPSLVV